MDLLPLAAVFFLSFLIESAVGFGSALVAVSIGAQLVPLKELFPVFQPLSLVLSLILVVRDRAHLQTRFLVYDVLPPMLPGVLLGLVLFRLGPADALLLVVGLAIAALALFELRRTLRGHDVAPLPTATARAVLLAAGVIHGLFGTSGPPVVWVTSRALTDKTAFRATLALLWLLLSVVLVVGYVVDGTLGVVSLGKSAMLSVPLVLGYLCGNALHHAVPQRTFRLGVCALLVVAGVVLVLRATTVLLGA